MSNKPFTTSTGHNITCWNRYPDFDGAVACAIRKTGRDNIRRSVRSQNVGGGARLWAVVEVAK